MWKPAQPLPISSEQTTMLQSWIRAHQTPQQVVTRCRIIVKATEGMSNNQIAQQLGIRRPTVLLWREGFSERGPAALDQLKAGRGRKASIAAAQVKGIVEATLKTKPKGATHRSCRSMAK